MMLSAPEVERFYAIWKPLILFVNRRLRLVPAMLPADFTGPWDIHEVKKVRDALWADDALREAFVTENPAGLPPQDLAIVDSWKHRKAGKFFLLKELKRYAVLIGENSTVYGVLGLTNPLGEIVPFLPCYVEAVLLPFEGRIIYDSLLVPYNVVIGRGIQADLEQTYRDAKERGPLSLRCRRPDRPAARRPGRRPAPPTPRYWTPSGRTCTARA